MGLFWLKRFRKPKQSPAPEPVGVRQVDLPRIGPVTVKRSLNCMGASCPRPQLLTMRALNEAQEGEVVEVLSDNPNSVEAIPAMMLVLCSTHLATVKDAGYWRVYVRKGL